MAEEQNHGEGFPVVEGNEGGNNAIDQVQDGFVMLDQPSQDVSAQDVNPTQATEAAKPQFGPSA